MIFYVIPRNIPVPHSGKNAAYLRIDLWNDYRFVTMFEVVLFDENGRRHKLGNVKIGFAGQTASTATHATLGESFTELDNPFFSLGDDADYYKILSEKVSDDCRRAYLNALRDIVYADDALTTASGQEVFRTSLLRSVSMTTITGQYKRILGGGAELTDFDFGYMRLKSDTYAGVDLGFKVTAASKPNTNVHAIIGRNGVGKTTLLNDMIDAIMTRPDQKGGFYNDSIFGRTAIPPNYFAGLVSVSFSAFDPFDPPEEQADPEAGPKYSYIGLKQTGGEFGKLKTLSTLQHECVSSIGECFADRNKRGRWIKAISTLESDENFERMNLKALAISEDWRADAASLVTRMSAGHAVVLLTMSKLVARVEEKTVVLLDEPESHLHPPLLSAFTRALSGLLQDRNGLAIIATHSPVVLQEVPRSCVWIITRSRLSASQSRPTLETFGENVGVLTREVFGLEVAKSGFHSLLAREVASGQNYEAILQEYDGQLGLEAKGILRAMVSEAQSGSDL
ncbi:AAA family ATPase [Rhizobium sp. NLR10a]|uniref:AAA family ATPase n=1 Tax=unclassified Rhizobium TaxID=2613769 RepID=UPI001C83DAD5|nr:MULTISPECIES: AAA family ATPase [unclassified Rhizobium]MBX5213959.1 AAA family ATPase [Rhizobium sp. NLR9a]MBX5218892.1 AAA family ATPase [Rhizobium sp. NLR8a]MBX5275348.1 AAA family ATPase [Rhizobium sp. NLR13a]MBX5281135.1 AAA family ATPase [Rhizobium sp. NLR10a]MBX5295446.1 AAA family ATPase [Rhizobium sp. NLR15a]